MEPEIVEWDCRTIQGSPRPEILADMQRCDHIWVPVPKVPLNPRMLLKWDWAWRPWRYRQGPSLPRQARFEIRVEVSGKDHDLDSLRGWADAKMVEAMRSRVQQVAYGLFLCFGEKYTQGLVMETSGSAATLTRVFVLLGRMADE